LRTGKTGEALPSGGLLMLKRPEPANPSSAARKGRLAFFFFFFFVCFLFFAVPWDRLEPPRARHLGFGR